MDEPVLLVKAPLPVRMNVWKSIVDPVAIIYVLELPAIFELTEQY